VGEIRDGETAEIAAHAALTGHMVLSTLHTTDAAAALPRFLDLGVPEHVMLDTLVAAMAQRLVRQVCPQCAQKVELPKKVIQALGPAAADLTTGVEPTGCSACRGTGYITRTGLFELMLITDAIRESFAARKSVRELRELAREDGMQTLREDGIAKVRAGITTAEEVLRVT
jgi:type II secretory ATPase GspE/PulE/Tfp pilus assembly ATPase PilB-like protein